MDMETSSSDEDEDGVITKDEQEEERANRLLNGGPSAVQKNEIPATLEDLERCRLSRSSLLKHFLSPWFPQYIKGMWVRYLIGGEGREPVYRICQVDREYRACGAFSSLIRPLFLKIWWTRPSNLTGLKKSGSIVRLSSSTVKQRENSI